MAERRALGRGLGTLLAGPEIPGVREVPVDAIAANPRQPRKRFDQEGIDSLTASIREQGVISPLILRRGRDGYELVAGERRLRAARLAGLKTVPAIVREVADAQALELALVENLQREDLNAVEAAEAYRRLVEDFGQSQDGVARRVGKDRSTVSNALRLLRLPRKILDDIVAGALAEGHARALLALDREADQIRARDLIVKGGLSVRGAEALVRRLKGPGAAARRRPRRDHNLAALEDRLRGALGTKVRIARRGKGGTVEIEFYSEEDLDRLLELLGAGR
ncbi:MAG TPA: ParB/RepB/Spo0J family partition protein [Candidatus Sulfotelmatobacter sp.]|nr:ParB/RepB/Spo0J family partition protein [Candidatus Sulfotelmatobacter sp.]